MISKDEVFELAECMFDFVRTKLKVPEKNGQRGFYFFLYGFLDFVDYDIYINISRNSIYNKGISLVSDTLALSSITCQISKKPQF